MQGLAIARPLQAQGQAPLLAGPGAGAGGAINLQLATGRQGQAPMAGRQTGCGRLLQQGAVEGRQSRRVVGRQHDRAARNGGGNQGSHSGWQKVCAEPIGDGA